MPKSGHTQSIDATQFVEDLRRFAVQQGLSSSQQASFILCVVEKVNASGGTIDVADLAKAIQSCLPAGTTRLRAATNPAKPTKSRQRLHVGWLIFAIFVCSFLVAHWLSNFTIALGITTESLKTAQEVEVSFWYVLIYCIILVTGLTIPLVVWYLAVAIWHKLDRARTLMHGLLLVLAILSTVSLVLPEFSSVQPLWLAFSLAVSVSSIGARFVVLSACNMKFVRVKLSMAALTCVILVHWIMYEVNRLENVALLSVSLIIAGLIVARLSIDDDTPALIV